LLLEGGAMKTRMFGVLVIGGGLLLAAASMGADGGNSPGQQDGQATELLTADQLSGMTVWSRQGELIGTVDEVILDFQERRVAYVVVTSGGFWGIGGERAIVPWKATSVQWARRLTALEQEQWKRQPGVQPGVQGSMRRGFDEEPVLVLDVDREVLMDAPRGAIQDTLDRGQAEQIHRHYGVSPYWQ
jgi:sporulation protein YlmC with PRC-barrel domain